MTPIARAAVLTALLLVSACGPLVQIGGGGDPPDSLLTLRAEASEARALTGKPLLVTMPSAPGALRTLRIPVTTEATEIAYLPKANWVEQPVVLFQRLLGEVVQARTGRPVLDERNVDIGAANRLSGRLVEFGLDVRGAPQVRVRYDAMVSATGTGYVASRSFEATRPVSAETGPAIARALNEAANEVAASVGDWIASQP
ncbi:ABC-type transport auxiliary lipoprotein family protein [Sphingosinicella microcystinivorans]|uniref:ABC-type transport auxiliary lipoprotein family protein n=1 Tax=Sphingosinicella microcystinivorans TaxID=335406 RepID=UPI0022F40669|nr:ABC-type transport auxiliary lipoprotein family protein [Sphingosinicella microcystinivorans]WBX85087.1 ABC-type transport auxiliary lipoprotein family protein [Sphingosinicella microcystinivorans]